MAANFSISRSPASTLFTATVCFTIIFSIVYAYESPDDLAAAPVAAAPAPLLAVPAAAPSPKILTLHEKVVGALRAAGHYGAISGLLDSLDDTLIKKGITFFAPDDGAMDGIQMNSSKVLTTTLDYHIATKVYDYQALENLYVNATIPTSVSDVKIVITSIQKNNFKVDDSVITDPDVYNDGTVAVHGINAVLATAKYNKGVVAPEAAPAPVAGIPAPAPATITSPAATTAAASPKGNGAATNINTSILITALIASAVSMILATL